MRKTEKFVSFDRLNKVFKTFFKNCHLNAMQQSHTQRIKQFQDKIARRKRTENKIKKKKIEKVEEKTR